MARTISISGISYEIIQQIDTQNIPDCFVDSVLKIGGGHGERKFYVSSKKEMCNFYYIKDTDKFDNDTIYKCFFLKKDIDLYLKVMEKEFINPTLPFRLIDENTAINKDKYGKISSLEQWYHILLEIKKNMSDKPYMFELKKCLHIKGNRGYVNALGNSENYDLLRGFMIPILTSVQVYKLKKDNEILFYWRPYADFEAMANPNRLLVLYYQNTKVSKGEKTEAQVRKERRIRQSKIKKYKDLYNSQDRKLRNGQSQYRADLIEEMRSCIFTKISDPSLLIASHIKPWAMCESEQEQRTKNNGLLLSPLYDKLFDRGFITFDEDGKVKCSSLISPEDWNKIEIDDCKQYLDPQYLKTKSEYLDYHRSHIFHE